MSKTVMDALLERGFIDNFSHEEIKELVKNPTKVYIGFDPTADSLHVGNFVCIMGLAWFQKFGHTPYAIVGGATGRIGDPSGKSVERPMLSEQDIERNLIGIRKNLESILDFKAGASPARILNNYDWFKDISFITYLREVGKYLRMGVMLSKESVKTRLNSEEGMSFTEFCYQGLQAYDFLRLYEKEGVMIQMGGSDQWGNMTAGIDLIRKVHGKSAHCMSFPLLTRSDGKKFGKSEEGAIWLSEEKLSTYDFYQYFVRIPDADVIKLMRMLTFMEMGEIRYWEKIMQESNYQPNTAQRKLAEEVTKLVRGEDGLLRALKATEAAKPGKEMELDLETFQALAAEKGTCKISASDLPMKIVDLSIKAGLASSKGEARRLVQNGGLYLNNQKVASETAELSSTDLIEGKFALLASGKKNKAVIERV